MLALCNRGHVLSQEYQNCFASIWHSGTLERREGYIGNFQDVATTLEQTFAGWKASHQLRMQPQSEPSVVVNQIVSASTISPTLANNFSLTIYFSACVN